MCDQFNPRFLLVLGFLLTAVSTYWFAWMDAHRGAHAGLGADRARRARVGLPAPGHVGLRTLAPEAISAASGLLNITRQIAGMGGIALAGVLLERWHYVHHLTGAEHFATLTGEVAQLQARVGVDIARRR